MVSDFMIYITGECQAINTQAIHLAHNSGMSRVHRFA